MDSLDVLPLLLQEGGQEIEGHSNVLSDLFIGHGLVGSGDVKAGNLLQLPLDGSSNIFDLSEEWFVVGDWSWESTNSVEHWSKDDWDLLDEGVSSEEEGVLLGPLLDELLVLVELLEVIEGGNFDIKSGGGGFISVFLIGNQTDLQVWSWDVWELDSSDESLIFLWIVILKGDLEFDGLEELSFLGVLLQFLDAFKHLGVGDFRGHSIFNNDNFLKLKALKTI